LLVGIVNVVIINFKTGILSSTKMYLLQEILFLMSSEIIIHRRCEIKELSTCMFLCLHPQRREKEREREREREKERGKAKGVPQRFHGAWPVSRVIRITLNSHGRGKGDTRLRIKLIGRDSNVPAGIPLSILIPFHDFIAINR